MTQQPSKKVAEFMAAYGELTRKHGVDFIAIPEYIPNEKGTFELTIRTIPVETEQKKTLNDIIQTP